MVECIWIFLSQEKYTMDIMKRFEMLYCKAITTPMESNLKLLCDASSDTINTMISHQMIHSLMYLTNTRLDICFDVNTVSQFLTGLRHVHLVVGKNVGYSGLWAQV